MFFLIEICLSSDWDTETSGHYNYNPVDIFCLRCHLLRYSCKWSRWQPKAHACMAADNTSLLAVCKIIALLQANINFENLLQHPPPHSKNVAGGGIWWFVYGKSVFFQLLKNRDVFMAILSRRLMAESWQQDKPGSLQAFTGNWARLRLGAGWPPNRDGINERLRWSQTVPSIMHLIPAVQIVTVGFAHISLKIHKYSLYVFWKMHVLKQWFQILSSLTHPCHFKPIFFLLCNCKRRC